MVAARPAPAQQTARQDDAPGELQILTSHETEKDSGVWIDGEYVGFGAVLSWREDDVTVRIYDDLLNLAHQAEFCDRIGELQMPLNEPQRMADWQQAMRTRFKAIGLIDRLIHQLSA